jgi:hypothetical protein
MPRLNQMTERQINLGVEARDARLIDEMYSDNEEQEESEHENSHSDCKGCRRMSAGRCLGSDCPLF